MKECRRNAQNPVGLRGGKGQDSCVALYLWDKIRNDFIGNSLRKRNIYQVLFSELSILEEAFSDYLKREVEVASAKTNGRDYPSSSTHLLKRLLSDGRPEPESCDILEHILSFSYTRPCCEMPTADKHGNISSTAVSLINVHGSLKEDDIIIGIDGKDCMSVPEAARFTKTFRVMGLESMRADSPSWIPLGNGAPSIDVIKFYGHSLSEADYSFFQALFDSVDL